MKIAGIDPSTKTGLAILKLEGTEIEVLAAREITSKKKGIEKAFQISDSVQIALSEMRPDKVMIEGYVITNYGTNIAALETAVMIRHHLLRMGLSYIEVSPTTLKKFVTGKGNFKGKEIMISEVHRRWGYSTASDNIADALGLAYVGVALAGCLAMPKRNMEALEVLANI